MSFPVRFGAVQIGLFLLILIGLALLVWAVLVINFLVDLAYQLVDPRLRRVKEAS